MSQQENNSKEISLQPDDLEDLRNSLREIVDLRQRLGSQVTVFSRSDLIMPREDPDAAIKVKKSMLSDGLTFAFNSSYKCIEGKQGEDEIRVVLDDNGKEKVFVFNGLLVATGRKPAVSNMGLEEAGVDFDVGKGVMVNDNLQTTNPDIYAVGDVASKYQFTHIFHKMHRSCT